MKHLVIFYTENGIYSAVYNFKNIPPTTEDIKEMQKDIQKTESLIQMPAVVNWLPISDQEESEISLEKVRVLMNDMLLKDTKEKQIVLNQDLLTKQLSITVYNKITKKKIIYTNPKRMCVLFAQCV